MTVVTVQRGLDVARMFAGGCHAVMAGETGLCDGRMIETGAKPANGIVTKIAFSGRLDVARVLAGCGHAVMTGTAAA